MHLFTLAAVAYPLTGRVNGANYSLNPNFLQLALNINSALLVSVSVLIKKFEILNIFKKFHEF